ncbi:MAG: hypothetical protein MUC87_14550 [Bacteroidia bacterium]|nr:hypothetical protein [Bacteroidia bacterium]
MKKQKKNTGKHSDADLAEAYIYPSVLTKAEKENSEAAFLALRKKKMIEATDTQRLISRLLQLRYHIEDYINAHEFTPDKSFTFFLNEYLRTIDKKKKDFAQEIQIHETKLSQIINGRVEPNDKFIIRLEIHSQNMFPALFWFKLIRMEQEYDLENNKEIRKKEARFVKKRLELNY